MYEPAFSLVLQASDASQRKQSTYAPPTMKGKQRAVFSLTRFLRVRQMFVKFIKDDLWKKNERNPVSFQGGLTSPDNLQPSEGAFLLRIIV